MQANGFGRSTVDNWIKIPSYTHDHATPKMFRHLQYHERTNPFEVLSDSSIHNLRKHILPNGEVIFSSFLSIEALSTYFSNLRMPHEHDTNLAQDHLNISNHSLTNMKVLTTKLYQHENDNVKTFCNDQMSLDSNPQTPCCNEQISDFHHQHQHNQHTPGNMSSITRAIDYWFEQVDFDIIHPDRARTICKRVGALLFISMEEWLEILHMDLHDLKETLREFHMWNKENTEKFIKGDVLDPRDMSYEDAMILGDDFQLQHLYYASDQTLRTFLQAGNKYYSFQYEKNATELTRSELIYELYEYLMKVLDVQGLVQNGTIVCPSTMDNTTMKKSVNAAFTPTTTDGKNPQKEHIKNKYVSPMKIERSPRGITSLKKRRMASPTTDTTSNTNIANDIEQEIDSTLNEKNIQAMLKLKLFELDKMDVPTMTPFIQAYSETYNVEISQDFFSKTPVKLMRDHLLVNILQLHSYYTTSVLNESTPSTFIEEMDVIQAYNEYYLAFHTEDLQFHDIIMIKPDDIKKELCEKQQDMLKELEDKMNECIESQTVTQSEQHKDVEMRDVDDENYEDTIVITVTADTSDLEIDMMSLKNACDEIVRISAIQGQLVKLEDVQKKYGSDVMKELKSLRSSLKISTLDPETEFLLLPTTTDESISHVNQKQALFAIRQYALDRKVLPDEAFLTKMSDSQLQDELRKARDVMKKGGKEITIPTLVRTRDGNKSQKELTQNLCGVDVTNFDTPSQTQTNDNQRTDKDNDESNHDFQAVSAKQEIITIHASVETKSRNSHAPTFIQKFVTELRKADPMLQIIPVESANNKSSQVLDGANLPVEQDKLEPWIVNIKQYKTKLTFTMKITTINLANVRSVIFAWCKGKGHWIDFTTLDAKTKFFGGWFHKLSPFYHNLDDFVQYIYKEAPYLDGKLDIYQKQIYNWSIDNQKVITSGIVVDGDLAIKNEAFKFLYEHKFTGRYSQVSFVPYKTNEVLTKEAQNKLIVSNTVWQKSLARIIIKVSKATTVFKIGQKSSTFQDWLYGCTIDKKNLILGVETIKDTAIRVFFDKANLAPVKHAVHNLYPMASQVFGPTVISTMLNEEELKRAKSSHETELTHSTKLTGLTGSPQGPDDASENTQPIEKRGRCFFGSYAEVTTNVTQTSELTQETIPEDLLTTVTKLTESYNELKNTFEMKLTTTIDTAFEQKIRPLQDKVNEMEKSHTTTHKEFMDMLAQKEEASEKKFEFIIKLLGGEKKAPSDAKRSPGVDK